MGQTLAKTTPKYGSQIRTEPKCKICQNGHRAEIEDILYLRSAGLLMESGVRPTADWIKRNSESLWGVRLTDENIQVHFKKHFAIGAPSTELVEQRDVHTQLREMLDREGIEAVTPDEFLQAVVAIGAHRIKLDPTKVTVDQALKAVDSLTRRKHDDAAAKLMQTLAAATGAAISKIPNPPEAPDSGDVIDAEVVGDEQPQ